MRPGAPDSTRRKKKRARDADNEVEEDAQMHTRLAMSDGPLAVDLQDDLAADEAAASKLQQHVCLALLTCALHWAVFACLDCPTQNAAMLDEHLVLALVHSTAVLSATIACLDAQKLHPSLFEGILLAAHTPDACWPSTCVCMSVCLYSLLHQPVLQTVMQVLLVSSVCNAACVLNRPCCCALQVGFQVEPGSLVMIPVSVSKLGMQCCNGPHSS